VTSSAVGKLPSLVTTVCDQPPSEPKDPVEVGTAQAFDATVRELRQRVDALVEA
jgi:hypothetical protein